MADIGKRGDGRIKTFEYLENKKSFLDEIIQNIFLNTLISIVC